MEYIQLQVTTSWPASRGGETFALYLMAPQKQCASYPLKSLGSKVDLAKLCRMVWCYIWVALVSERAYERMTFSDVFYLN